MTHYFDHTNEYGRYGRFDSRTSSSGWRASDRILHRTVTGY